jgi:glycosyltransferase involved in cell wall biosynthesis
LQKPNGGLSSARNFGIRHARGKYVLPLDSDNLLDPRYLGRAAAALERMPDVAAVTCFLACFADGTPPTRVADYIAPYDLHPLLIALENRAGDACAMFRREIFDRFRYQEELRSYEDWDLWWQMAEAGQRVEAMPMTLLRYRTRPDSMVRTIGTTREQQILASFADRHADFLRAHGDDVFRATLRRIKELERHVRVLRKYSLAYRLAEFVLRRYHSVQANPRSLTGRLLRRLCRRSAWMRRLCAKLDRLIP